MVEPTHLKNMSQNGNLPQIGMNIYYIWNHQPLVHDFFWELFTPPSIRQSQNLPAKPMTHDPCFFRSEKTQKHHGSKMEGGSKYNWNKEKIWFLKVTKLTEFIFNFRCATLEKTVKVLQVKQLNNGVFLCVFAGSVPNAIPAKTQKHTHRSTFFLE